MNHAIMLVGYNASAPPDGDAGTGTEFWVVKNSLGVDWGEAGFFRLQRGAGVPPDAAGGAYTIPSYPLKYGPDEPPRGPPAPPAPVVPPTRCDEYHTCPDTDTCCCLGWAPPPRGRGGGDDVCLAWGCCPYKDGSCCDGGEQCCPKAYPVCDLRNLKCLAADDDGAGVGGGGLEESSGRSRPPCEWSRLRERPTTRWC